MLADDVPTLLSLLAQSVSQHQAKINAARVEAVTDERILTALGDGGLLPPSDDLGAALRILADEKILAWSGWQYLSGIRADERDQVLAATRIWSMGSCSTAETTLNGTREADRRTVAAASHHRRRHHRCPHGFRGRRAGGHRVHRPAQPGDV